MCNLKGYSQDKIDGTICGENVRCMIISREDTLGISGWICRFGGL